MIIQSNGWIEGRTDILVPCSESAVAAADAAAVYVLQKKKLLFSLKTISKLSV